MAEQIATLSDQERNQAKESISQTIIDTIGDIHSLSIHDYNFDDYFKREIYESFQYIPYEIFEELYVSVKEPVLKRHNIAWRSFKEDLHLFDYCDDRHSTQIEYLKSIPQPEQRTREWLEFRKNHFTGSNSWKIFSSDATRNQLLFEKLEPQDPNNKSSVQKPNLNDQLPMNWGHKYEPLSIILYEYYNDVTVEEFGCIEHPYIPCLAASPDGIVTSNKNNGRMVEIKNPTTREITQTPKMDYYIQMQLQMEVCDLESCDFVETKFVEYDTFSDFRNDKYKIERGMIIVLIKDGVDLVYEYSPLFKNSDKELEEFSAKVYQKYGFDDSNLESGRFRWFKNVYWGLQQFSCVYVPRNRKWFECALPQIEELWKKVVDEREIPDSHLKYKAKSRTPKTIVKQLADDVIDLN